MTLVDRLVAVGDCGMNLAEYMAKYYPRQEQVKMPELEIAPLWSDRRIAKAVREVASTEALLRQMRDEYEARIREIYSQCEYLLEFQRKGHQSIHESWRRLQSIEWEFQHALERCDRLEELLREKNASYDDNNP